MKFLPWLCGLSLAANLALVARLATAPATGPATPDAPALTWSSPSPASASAAATATSEGGAPSPYLRADTPLARLLDGTDYAAMRDALAAAGLTADDARALIRARLHESQKTARLAIDQRPNPADATWWFDDAATRTAFEETRRADRAALDAEITATLAALLGPEPAATATLSATSEIHAQAAFLPEDKRAAVSSILRDYEAMLLEARPRGYTGPDLPSDSQKREFIETERRKDLAALLSPEELRAFDLRHSATAVALRKRLDGMRPNLAEYEAVYDATDTLTRAQRGFDYRTATSADWRTREETRRAAMARLRDSLGEERFVDYAISMDPQNEGAREAAKRFQLPPETLRTLWQLRRENGDIYLSIYRDASLPFPTKQERVTALAREAEAKLRKMLPGDAYDEMSKSNLVGWVTELSVGRFTDRHEDGSGSSSYKLF